MRTLPAPPIHAKAQPGAAHVGPRPTPIAMPGRAGGGARHRFGDLAIAPRDPAPVQLKDKARRRKSRPAPAKPASAQDADDRSLSFRALPPGPVRAYRMEASTQQYDDDSGRPKWAHFHIGSQGQAEGPRGNLNNAHYYTPKPKANYSSAAGKGGKGGRYVPDAPTLRHKSKTKGIARDDQRYAAEFLKNKRDTGRNDTFVNFGEPQRALEFYRQKKANEPHLNFSIKSTLIPASTFAELQKQAVHEADAKKYPDRPYNVDRKAPNQLGLRERHVDLLNSTAIRGSARVEDIDALEKKHGPALDAAERAEKAEKKAAPARKSPPKSARKLRKGKKADARKARAEARL